MAGLNGQHRCSTCSARWGRYHVSRPIGGPGRTARSCRGPVAAGGGSGGAAGLAPQHPPDRQRPLPQPAHGAVPRRQSLHQNRRALPGRGHGLCPPPLPVLDRWCLRGADRSVDGRRDRRVPSATSASDDSADRLIRDVIRHGEIA